MINEPHMSVAASDLNPTDDEIRVFNEWFGEFMNDSKKLPGGHWRNVLRDIRGNMFRSFLTRYRDCHVMRFQRK